MNQNRQPPLHALREEILMMCGLAERNLELAMRALAERDDRLADLAEAGDSEVDQLEIRIDEMVVSFISTHVVAASDTRFVLTVSRIANNLERIADEATTIARRARELNGEPPLQPLIEIPIMATTAQEMLRAAIGTFVEQQPEEAVEIIARDKSVDDLYKSYVRELTTHMGEHSGSITRALRLMTIAKALERVADHATNIAEEVFYLFKGDMIRHDHTLKGK